MTPRVCIGVSVMVCLVCGSIFGAYAEVSAAYRSEGPMWNVEATALPQEEQIEALLPAPPVAQKGVAVVIRHAGKGKPPRACHFSQETPDEPGRLFAVTDDPCQKHRHPSSLAFHIIIENIFYVQGSASAHHTFPQ